MIRRAALAPSRTYYMFLFPDCPERKKNSKQPEARARARAAERSKEQRGIKTKAGGQNDALSPSIVLLARCSLGFLHLSFPAPLNSETLLSPSTESMLLSPHKQFVGVSPARETIRSNPRGEKKDGPRLCARLCRLSPCITRSPNDIVIIIDVYGILLAQSLIRV